MKNSSKSTYDRNSIDHRTNNGVIRDILRTPENLETHICQHQILQNFKLSIVINMWSM